jgi:GntR family transcriptional regulator/MocR family aminotransferase
MVELRRDVLTPLHSQLEHELRVAIRSGRLAGGSALPSTRALARELDLSRGVVVEAYEQLIAEGYLTSRPGGATSVSRDVAETGRLAAPIQAQPPYRFDFGYGRPDVTEFPRQAWLRSLRRVLNEAPASRLGYLGGRGAPELHVALAAYLNRVRRTAASPDRVVICNGFAQGLGLVMDVLKGSGATRVAAEDPGQSDTYDAAGRAGLEVVPIDVDEDGLVVDALDRTAADAVVVTPAHQFPTGAVLSAERRAALVAWAKARGALIIEDDYDAEYRYDREPIGSIQGLSPDRVIYAGSASKTLAPGLRLGWLVPPRELVEPVSAAKEAVDRGSASLEQLAFADFLSRGEFDRHLRRMRPVYRRRRDVLLASLRSHVPDLRPAGASAGLHVVAWLPDGVDEQAVTTRAAALGVGVQGVSRHRTADGGPAGLLFGYGAISEIEIDEGIRLVAQAVQAEIA